MTPPDFLESEWKFVVIKTKKVFKKYNDGVALANSSWFEFEPSSPQKIDGAIERVLKFMRLPQFEEGNAAAVPIFPTFMYRIEEALKGVPWKNLLLGQKNRAMKVE